jgi:stress response protein YsnF
MLSIEKGGDKQMEEELHCYNPMIPQGKELIFTLMFQYTDPAKRRKTLVTLGHVENQVFITFEGEKVQAIPITEETTDIERTTSEGKTSAVHFLQFKFNEEQVIYIYSF